MRVAKVCFIFKSNTVHPMNGLNVPIRSAGSQAKYWNSIHLRNAPKPLASYSRSQPFDVGTVFLTPKTAYFNRVKKRPLYSLYSDKTVLRWHCFFDPPKCILQSSQKKDLFIQPKPFQCFHSFLLLNLTLISLNLILTLT